MVKMDGIEGETYFSVAGVKPNE